MVHTKNSLRSQRPYIFVLVIFLIAFIASSSYRGIVHSEGIGTFRQGAERIVAHQPLLTDSDLERGAGEIKLPARLIYVVFIALGYKLFGFNLLAFHIFPYLLQIINPCLFFLVAYRLYKSIWWGLAGALFFIVHPFNLIYLNQQHNHPVFIFFLLILLLLFDQVVKNPQLLPIFGIVSSLLILTRFEGGVIFVAILYVLYILYRWNIGIPVKWIIFSFGTLLLTHLLFAISLGFPVYYSLYYLPQVFQRQATVGASYSFYNLTMQAFRYFLYWFFSGKLIAPFLLLFMIIGTFVQVRKRNFCPIAIFGLYFMFLLFIYNGRFDVTLLAVATFCVPGFILLLLEGIQVVGRYCYTLVRRVLPNNPLHVSKFQRFPVFQNLVSVVMIIGIMGFFGRAGYSLAIITEDAIPASTIWRIVKHNPPMPGNPVYKEPFFQLNREEQVSMKLREELIKRVRGNYRSWYLNKIGKEAFEQKLPEQARASADFSYVDDYRSKEKWEKDRVYLEGSSPLWNDQHPGRIGAFPLGKSGSFVYKFDFFKPIDYVTISDVHTQWGMGDVTKMWTSTDGEQWILKYNNWNVKYTRDYYYQFFEDEFEGHKTLFIKYYFYAGDKTRAENDNRGASLEEFSLAVKYKE